MPRSDEWFDKLYLENSPRMIKQATYLLRNQQIAEDLVNESFLILLYKRQDLVHHPNLPGWLSQTLKNLIIDELKSARHRLELPLNPDVDVSESDNATTYHPPLSELLPRELTPREREILILVFEKQLSYEQIAARLHTSVLNCRTRLFRAKAHYKKISEYQLKKSPIL
jgi:RNA polymerase sigma-70 factor (ECF subfamily)